MLKTLKQSLKPAKQWLDYQRLPAATSGASARAGSHSTCVISAADPGGLGDAAMVNAIADQYSADGLDITAWRPGAPKFPNTRGQVDIAALRSSGAEQVLTRYRRLGCVGADVMDGLYAYAQSCLRLRLLSLAAAMGLDSRLFGFSFNATPHDKTRQEFRNLHKDVIVCVRDPISYARLERVTDHQLRLVADLAFLVRPVPVVTPQARQAGEWLQRHREAGHRLIGLNIHPMFSFDHGDGITEALVQSFAHLIEERGDAAFVLIPHDFRPIYGDVPALEKILSRLTLEARARATLVSDITDYGVLKTFVSELDGVLTGRMHLSIAALGQGVPVAGVTYQGKFEGLLQHFDLNEGCTIAPPDAADPGKLLEFFGRWVDQLTPQARAIAAHLPKVTELSRLNFA